MIKEWERQRERVRRRERKIIERSERGKVTKRDEESGKSKKRMIEREKKRETAEGDLKRQ